MLDARTILDDAFGEEPLSFSEGRTLTSSDLALLASGAGVSRSSPPSIKRLRARHHALAKALAEGMRPGIAAATYGYDPSRVSILQGDPTFGELVAHYRKEVDHDYRRVHERLADLSVEALDEIERRLEDEPEKISVTQLTKLVEMTADRTGHGPKASQDVNVNIGFADRLREARKRLEAKVPSIEGEIEDAVIIPKEAAE